MSLPHLIMWLVVLLMAAPAAFRNPTAAALALCYLFAEGLALTGRGLAVEYYTLPDIFVLAVIMAKPERWPCPAYSSAWHQVWCLLGERSYADRFVMLSYPIVWYFYVAPISAHTQYWMLWWSAIAQFLAVCAETLVDTLARRREADRDILPPGADLLVAYRRRDYG